MSNSKISRLILGEHDKNLNAKSVKSECHENLNTIKMWTQIWINENLNPIKSEYKKKSEYNKNIHTIQIWIK